MRRRSRGAVIVAMCCLTVASNSADGSELQVIVDPRIELLITIQLFVPQYDGMLTRYDVQYKKRVLDRFSHYESHQAVCLFKEIIAEGIFSHIYPRTMLHLGNPPDHPVAVDIPQETKSVYGGAGVLAKFLDALREFARTSRFMQFFRCNRGFYDEIVESVQQQLREQAYIEAMEAYYGVGQNSYTLILSPLLHHGGFGPRIEVVPGSYDVYGIIGPAGAEEGLPRFGPISYLEFILWHEFGHSFVNPLTSEFATQFKPYSSLLNPISETMRKLGYPGWEIVVNEHVVRAVTMRLAFLHKGPEEGRKALDQEEERGFSYVKRLCNALERYESARQTYANLQQFYPEIVEVFRSIQEKTRDSHE